MSFLTGIGLWIKSNVVASCIIGTVVIGGAIATPTLIIPTIQGEDTIINRLMGNVKENSLDSIFDGSSEFDDLYNALMAGEELSQEDLDRLIEYIISKLPESERKLFIEHIEAGLPIRDLFVVLSPVCEPPLILINSLFDGPDGIPRCMTKEEADADYERFLEHERLEMERQRREERERGGPVMSNEQMEEQRLQRAAICEEGLVARGFVLQDPNANGGSRWFCKSNDDGSDPVPCEICTGD